MGKFFLGAETERVTFPDGEWVDVKQELTQEDSDYILEKMAGTSGKRIDIKLGKLPLLERSIVAWSFEDVPVNPENISKLRARYRVLVLEKIDALNIKAQEFTKNSSTAST